MLIEPQAPFQESPHLIGAELAVVAVVTEVVRQGFDSVDCGGALTRWGGLATILPPMSSLGVFVGSGAATVASPAPGPV